MARCASLKTARRQHSNPPLRSLRSAAQAGRAWGQTAHGALPLKRAALRWRRSNLRTSDTLSIGANISARALLVSALKNIAIRHRSRTSLGEAMITDYGIEGGAIYALTADLRATAPTEIRIDLRPDLRLQHVVEKLAKAKRGDTLSSTLRKALGLSPAAIALLYENGPPPRDPEQLTELIKSIPLKLKAPHGIDRAISTAGGVAGARSMRPCSFAPSPTPTSRAKCSTGRRQPAATCCKRRSPPAFGPPAPC